MTQCERVLDHIEKYGYITQADADRLKVKRLASRIYDLKKRGHNIVVETIYGKNEYGKWHCACYKKAV